MGELLWKRVNSPIYLWGSSLHQDFLLVRPKSLSSSASHHWNEVATREEFRASPGNPTEGIRKSTDGASETNFKIRSLLLLDTNTDANSLLHMLEHHMLRFPTFESRSSL